MQLWRHFSVNKDITVRTVTLTYVTQNSEYPSQTKCMIALSKNLDSQNAKSLSEGTFSRVVAHIIYYYLNVWFNCRVATVDIFHLVHSAVRFRGSCQLRWLGLGCVSREKTHLIPDICGCHVLRILAVAVCRIGDVCCLPAPTHQPLSFNSYGLSAPEEACSRNVRAPGTLKFGYEGTFKITGDVTDRQSITRTDE